MQKLLNSFTLVLLPSETRILKGYSESEGGGVRVESPIHLRKEKSWIMQRLKYILPFYIRTCIYS